MAFCAPVSLQSGAKPAASFKPKRRYGIYCSTHVSSSTEASSHRRRTAIAQLSAGLLHFKNKLRQVESFSRPGSTAGAEGRMRNRYNNLPDGVKGPNQMLGRMSPGCEGTHGVFPKCNFACKPCYHSEDANHVRVDGMHTLTQIARQMHMLQKQRGPVAHCQLIGGEVTLLPAADHARALEVMRFYGRVPMSFTHGDFTYEYLVALAVTPEGKPRFRRLDFAVHFDMYMYGRSGIPRPESEKQLHQYRKRFVEMFQRLRREHGVRFYLAHNMTVQPGNFGQIADVVREIQHYGFRLLSFQPAALQGAKRRRVPGIGNDGDALWREIERGAGSRLPHGLFQMGDPRCNRVSFCAVVGVGLSARIVPVFDDTSEGDARFRDAMMFQFGSIALPPALLWVKGARLLLGRPWMLALIAMWAVRFLHRCGNLMDLLLGRVRLLTFVMHRFMDADDVRAAWSLMEDGCDETSKEVQDAGPRVLETVERLRACSYGMAQVAQGRVVPACVQHSVYDPAENKALAQELRIGEKARSSAFWELEE